MSAHGVFLGTIRRLGGYKEILIPAMVLTVVLLLIVPVSSGLLDVLFFISISISLAILLTTMFVSRALEFSVFPSLLLVVTLYRLALNISSTRLILTRAEAGRVIDTFGGTWCRAITLWVLSFLIITIVQFIVITNGAGRVAEVAAALHWMPCRASR